ncbi:EI24 domain-containing protein [Campylobacter insulaenigrae]|uniref:EI24 domain-containing protein n=1 Tax=Campylobacter insulaenigrae TaxID=260714 RepID=UPI0021520DC5|nr:EI24 domain-containing protein [Campylobacter insulaenigrae]MCR6590812.1 EI24 domain-containing protein [Campylobacter insulaenigrae]MCR6592489.1 EI24 domain-containing protein [Campylobacter insulaenigrae]
MNILYLSLQDFFNKSFLKFAFLPLLFSVVLLSLCVYYTYNTFFYYLDDFTSNSWFAWFFSFSIVQFSLTFLSVIGGFFIVIFASVFLSMLIVSFLTPYVVKKINSKYYHHIMNDEINFLEILLKILKILFIGIILFILATFLLIIPFVSIVVYYGVFYYFFHKFLILDVGSCVLDKTNFRIFFKNSSPLLFKLITFIFFLLSSVPLLGLFLQVFYVIFLTHLFYQKVLLLQANQNT